MYLILALDEDIHADAVLYYLKKLGKKVKRFDPAFLFDYVKTLISVKKYA